MYNKLNEVKVLRDPIHGYIHIEYKIIWDCLNSKEFQRLRRIKQLGSSYVVYHTAEHSRFSHSCGVYEITRRMINEIKDIRDSLNEEEKVTVLLAALLHDIGHGPFSHSFELVSNINHEEYTKLIIRENSEIHEILEKEEKGLSEKVISVIDHTHKNKLLPQLISGQLDVDRMDYLLRDAYFTGTKYGEFDIERIFRTIRVKDEKIVIKKSGIFSIEDYIMARYHMYWQVYYHPVARSFEAILVSLFERMRDLINEDRSYLKEFEIFSKFIGEEKASVNDLFIMDENTCLYGINKLCDSKDLIIKDLADRIINRNLFKYIDYNEKDLIDLKDKLKNKYNLKYYIRFDNVKQSPYHPYTDTRAIWILDNDNIYELSNISNIVNSIIHGNNINDKKIYFPK